jgi:hypothetical protein
MSIPIGLLDAEPAIARPPRGEDRSRGVQSRVAIDRE